MESIHIVVERIEYTETATYGTLCINGQEYKTLEPKWYVNNCQGSAIPQGKYLLVRRNTAKRGEHLHVLNVKNREWILIHTGNTHNDTTGCILVGKNRRGSSITKSRIALNEILQQIGNNKFIILTIKNM